MGFITAPANPAPIALWDGLIEGNSNAVIGAANTVVFVPQIVNYYAILNGIIMKFNAGGNGHYDVGIFDASGANGLPGACLANAAATATSLASGNGVKKNTLRGYNTVGGNLQLNPGKYYLALWVDNNTDTVIKTTTFTTGLSPVQSGTYATGPLPANASSVTALGNAAIMPLIIGLFSGGWQG